MSDSKTQTKSMLTMNFLVQKLLQFTAASYVLYGHPDLLVRPRYTNNTGYLHSLLLPIYSFDVSALASLYPMISLFLYL